MFPSFIYGSNTRRNADHKAESLRFTRFLAFLYF